MCESTRRKAESAHCAQPPRATALSPALRRRQRAAWPPQHRRLLPACAADRRAHCQSTTKASPPLPGRRRRSAQIASLVSTSASCVLLWAGWTWRTSSIAGADSSASTMRSASGRTLRKAASPSRSCSTFSPTTSSLTTSRRWASRSSSRGACCSSASRQTSSSSVCASRFAACTCAIACMRCVRLTSRPSHRPCRPIPRCPPSMYKIRPESLRRGSARRCDSTLPTLTAAMHTSAMQRPRASTLAPDLLAKERSRQAALPCTSRHTALLAAPPRMMQPHRPSPSALPTPSCGTARTAPRRAPRASNRLRGQTSRVAFRARFMSRLPTRALARPRRAGRGAATATAHTARARHRPRLHLLRHGSRAAPTWRRRAALTVRTTMPSARTTSLLARRRRRATTNTTHDTPDAPCPPTVHYSLFISSPRPGTPRPHRNSRGLSLSVGTMRSITRIERN